MMPRRPAPFSKRRAARPEAHRTDGLISERARTPAQLDRLERLREAARELARDGGYPSVTMRAVAERAGVGPATVYRYFASKDHLIADVHIQKSLELIAELVARPPRHRRAADRLFAVFQRMLEAAVEDLALTSAGVAAINSSEVDADLSDFWRGTVMPSYIEVALGDEEVADREALAEVLGHVFFSLMCGLAIGRIALAEAEASMERAIGLVLR